jgi:cell division protein FtsQ
MAGPPRTGTPRRWSLVRARRDPPASAARRWARRLRTPGLAQRLALFVVVAAAGFAAIGALAFATAIFAVRTVEVSGVATVTADDVRRAAGVPLGTPLPRVDPVDVERRVESLPPVADAAVRRIFPHTLQIRIVERVAVGALPRGRGFELVDAAGVVFHTVAARPDGVVVLRLATPGPHDPATRAAITVALALTPRLRSATTEIVVASPARISVELTGDRVVIWGDASQSETKATVATALLDTPGRVIDVSTPGVATVRS